MIRRKLFLGITLWAASAVAAYGETYTWTDNQGTVHFSEDAAAVPAKYRNKVRVMDENDSPPAETAPEPQAAEGGGTTAAGKSGSDASADLPNYTTRDEWQAELQKQGKDTAAIRQRLDELAAAMKSMPQRTAERDKLAVEYQTLLPQHNAMKDRFYRLVDAARKAGFPVDLQQ